MADEDFFQKRSGRHESKEDHAKELSKKLEKKLNNTRRQRNTDKLSANTNQTEEADSKDLFDLDLNQKDRLNENDIIFSYFVFGVEVILVTYFILALIDIVPMF